MFESSSKSRKSWDGRQMIRQCIPDTRSNRWKWFGGCHGGFAWGNTYWQIWRQADCSGRYISWDERCKIGWLLKLQHPESYPSLVLCLNQFCLFVYYWLYQFGTQIGYVLDKNTTMLNLALRSSSSFSICVPPRKTTMAASKSFSSVAPSIWNSLPNHLSSIPFLPVFRRALKHHLFLLAYPNSSAKSGKIKPAQCITLRDTAPTTATALPANTMPPI